MHLQLFIFFVLQNICAMLQKYFFLKEKFSALTTFRVTEEVTAKLIESAYHNIERDGILATRLCTHKDDVELTNENRLQQLPGLNSSIQLYVQYVRSLSMA